MESLSTLEIYRTLQDEGIALLTLSDLQRRFRVANTNTAYKMLQRLVGKGLLTRVRGGVYTVTDRPIHDFALANALVAPSYVSLESALSRYGVLSQAPFTVTSITVRKGRTIETPKKTLEYAHIAPHVFTGFVKEQDYVIATPEKALFDAVYLAAKGLRRVPVDELDVTAIDKKIFYDFCTMARMPQLRAYLADHPFL